MSTSAERKAFYISTVIHGSFLLVLAFMTFWAWLAKPKPEPHVFEMVSAPPSQQQTQQAPINPAHAQPQLNLALPEDAPELPEVLAFEIPQPQPEPTPVVPQPQRPPTPAPAQQQAPKPEETKRVTYDPSKYANTPQPPARTAPRPTAPAPNVSLNAPRIDSNKIQQPNASSSTAPSTSSADIDNYKAGVRLAIDLKWSKPRGLAGGLSAEVIFTIQPSGEITGLRFTRSSGNSTFDASIREAFARVGRVQPPITGNSMTLTLPFRLD